MICSELCQVCDVTTISDDANSNSSELWGIQDGPSHSRNIILDVQMFYAMCDLLW